MIHVFSIFYLVLIQYLKRDFTWYRKLRNVIQEEIALFVSFSTTAIDFSSNSVMDEFLVRTGQHYIFLCFIKNN
ncbi:MAG: hypothetical protein CSA81_12235 [Acidobacteria bacterium]|nr:MAG: hypothetical protein CSA81_12235 [Acidobacteriota bacterium]